MSDIDALLAADAARRQAMTSGNPVALAAMLSDDLVWTHSSGRVDDKAAILKVIEEKTVLYLALEVEGVKVSRHGDIFICNGTLNGRVSRDGAERELRNRFLSVWKRTDAAFQMLAWQSTGI